MFSFESRKYLKNQIEYLTGELEESEDSARQYRDAWRTEQDRADELQKELNKAQFIERELRAADEEDYNTLKGMYDELHMAAQDLVTHIRK